jgi:hypothetical protein
LDRLQREQRHLAAAGMRSELDASRTLLRQVISFEPDLAAPAARLNASALLVVSAGPPKIAHVLVDGLFVGCFATSSRGAAIERAKELLLTCNGTGLDADAQEQERNLIRRWLTRLGPEHRLTQLCAP